MKRTATLLLAAAALAACGDDLGNATPRGDLDITVEPQRRWYQTEQPVMLVGFVTDEKGNLIIDAKVHWTVEPENAATVVDPGAADPTYTLHKQGQVRFTGCIEGTTACDAVTLQVDDGSPVLELTSPRPGGESDHAGGIEVTGSVADGGKSRVFVAGKSVDVDPLGKFQAVVPAQYGVNHLTVAASDGVTPEAALEMDVLWAPRFAAATVDGKPSIQVDDGITLSLGRKLFDDGVAVDTAPDPIITSDLTDILQLVLVNADLKSLIPDPVVNQPGVLLLRIPDLKIGPVATSLAVRGDGVDLFLRLSQLELTTLGNLTIDTTSASLAGTVTASVAGSVHLTLHKDPGGELVVEVAGMSLALESATSHFASDDANALFRLAQGLLRKTIEQQLVSAVGTKLTDALPTVLRNVLTALDTALANKELVLDTAPFPVPVTLQIDGRLRSVQPRAGIEILAALGARLGTTSAATHADSRGVPMSEIEDVAPPFYREKPLQLGVRLAFVNGLLHSLWNSGMFEIDLARLVGGSIGDLLDKGTLSVKLAPHLRAPRPGEPGRFDLSIGQLEIDLKLKDGAVARFGCSLDVEVDIGIADNTFAVTAPGEPRIRMWTIVPSESALLNADLIRTLLLQQWPSIRDAITHALKVELPIPSLGDLGGIAPALANLELSLELAEPPYLQSGYLMVTGTLRGTLAKP